MLKFDRPTLLTITAPTCSGKSYLMQALETELGFTRIVSTTTRPQRVGEVEGRDYFFISESESRDMELNGSFAELIEFRGVRYGVTHAEMDAKMHGDSVPMVILEPQGLEAYKKICVQNNWDVYSVYVTTVESERIRRLTERTIDDVRLTLGSRESTARVIHAHTDRLLSITTEERRWSNTTIWNTIVPGDDVDTALRLIQFGIKVRNQRVAEPKPYDHKV